MLLGWCVCTRCLWYRPYSKGQTSPQGPLQAGHRADRGQCQYRHTFPRRVMIQRRHTPARDMATARGTQFYHPGVRYHAESDHQSGECPIAHRGPCRLCALTHVISPKRMHVMHSNPHYGAKIHPETASCSSSQLCEPPIAADGASGVQYGFTVIHSNHGMLPMLAANPNPSMGFLIDINFFSDRWSRTPAISKRSDDRK